MANPEHVEILKQGVEGWNEWEKKYPSISVDLSWEEFDHLDLKGINLMGARLNGSKINESDLSGSDLYSANLRGAKLKKRSLKDQG